MTAASVTMQSDSVAQVGIAHPQKRKNANVMNTENKTTPAMIIARMILAFITLPRHNRRVCDNRWVKLRAFQYGDANENRPGSWPGAEVCWVVLPSGWQICPVPVSGWLASDGNGLVQFIVGRR
jgi:hypothetical protein